MTDMKYAIIRDGDAVQRLTQMDDERRAIDTSHVEMMTKAIKILQREEIDPKEYQFALAHARTLPDSEKTRIAMESEYFSEMVPEYAASALINCVMDG
jgi:hypothetical protein